MKRRQKKVQEFQEALKVGDKVVTTSGIYGQITKLNDKSVQVQIADKVRIEVARAAVGGYQGQDPVVVGHSNQVVIVCTRTFAGNLTIVARPRSSSMDRRLPAPRRRTISLAVARLAAGQGT